ncbi:MAG: hypothetical protein ABL886_10840 [Rhodoglobus sp.]
MPDHRADETEHVGVEEDTASRDPQRRRGRRARTQAPAGSDPNPTPEPGRHAESENDERLKRDKPPHWG